MRSRKLKVTFENENFNYNLLQCIFDNIKDIHSKTNKYYIAFSDDKLDELLSSKNYEIRCMCKDFCIFEYLK